MPAATTAYVTRTELSLTNLSLLDPGVYRIGREALEAGMVTWRRQLVTSPFVHGAYEVGAVKDQVQGASLLIRVWGTSQSNLQSRVTTLLAAFTQSTYDITVGLDGTLWTWRCMRADYKIGFPDSVRRQTVAPVTLSFPRHPVAVAGPY